ncbi:MAG: gamma-glutamylcyclotransferase [Acidobacteria bacterium]|nr:gamma-glutamylcyclotransferase [Acidobacteriota bacterium]
MPASRESSQSAVAQSDKLFVYGSLRRGYPLHWHLRRHGARFLGVGVIQASWRQQYPYPGALPSDCALDKIEGELYLLREPARQLKQLDELEEVNSAQPEKGLYVRRLVKVRLPTGQQHVAWTYFLPNRPTQRRLITGGSRPPAPLSQRRKRDEWNH